MDNIESDATFMAAERGQAINPNVAHFYYHPVLNPQKTAERGVEIYEDRVYIIIISPGQRLSEIRRKATDKDKLDYPRQYDAFLNGNAQPIIGTPLAMLPGVTPARVKELQYLNIRTVQHLIDMPDSVLPKIGPDARDLQNRARAFIEKNDPIIIGLEFEIKELKQKLLELSAQVASLSPATSQGQQPARRRGRPPGSKKVNGNGAVGISPKIM